MIYTATDANASNATKYDIQLYAEELAKNFEYEPNSTTIDTVCKNIGVDLEFINPLLDEDNFNGSMFIDKDEKTIKITLSNLTNDLRNNFTIAHELGHLFLHSQNIKERKISFNRFGSNRLEWEANWFAAAFLMPESRFKDKNTEYNGSLYDLSFYFNVSESAIRIRKKELGI